MFDICIYLTVKQCVKNMRILNILLVSFLFLDKQKELARKIGYQTMLWHEGSGFRSFKTANWTITVREECKHEKPSIPYDN